MKRIFTLLIACLFINFLSAAAPIDVTFTWTGAAGDNNWNTPSNWSSSPDYSACSMWPRNHDPFSTVGGCPSSGTSIVAKIVFNGSATVNVPATTVGTFVNSININSGTVQLQCLTSGSNIFALQTNTTGGLTVNLGATLKIGGNAVGLQFLSNSSNLTNTINGTLWVEGLASDFANRTDFGKVNGANVVTTVNGTIKATGDRTNVSGWNSNALIFNSGSKYSHEKNGGTIPEANYKSGSMLLVKGIVSTFPQFPTNTFILDGNIEWDCPSQAVPDGSSYWSVPGGITSMSGTITMLSGYFVLRGTGLVNGITFGNFVISGGELRLIPAANATNNFVNNITITSGRLGLNFNTFSVFELAIQANGNVSQSGGTLDLSGGLGKGILKVAGTFEQTGGVLTESASSVGSTLVFTGGNAQQATFAANGLTGNELNVEINKSSNHVLLLTTLTIPRNLILTSNCIKLGGNNVVVNNLVTGGSATSHVVTDGIGTLKILGVDAVGKNFPTGVTTTSFDPVNIKNTTGINDFAVSVSSAITAGVPSTYTNIIPRQWEIISTSASATLALTPGTGVAGSPDIGHYIGGAWVFTASSTASPTYTGTFTSFSPFIIAGQVLPVELISFTVKKAGSVNALYWQTASEKNNSHFDVERSNNGQTNWTNMGMVKGNGNSLVTQNYSFSDNTPLSISYYRLKQVDNDGNFSYSNVVSVVDKKGKFNIASVAPNPTNETSTILFESAKNENVLVTLTDVSGRVILTQNAVATEGVNALNFNMSSLSNGLYIIRLSNNEQVLTQKLIKE